MNTTGNNTKTGARALAVQARHLRALELRQQGNTYTQIAGELGYYDKAAAYKGVRSAMREARLAIAQPTLQMELERLDHLQAIASELIRNARDGEALARAVSLCLAVMDRRARYLGLYEFGQESTRALAVEEEVKRLSELTGLSEEAIREEASEIAMGHRKD